MAKMNLEKHLFPPGGAILQVGARCSNVAQFCLCEGLGLGHFEPRAQTERGCTIPGEENDSIGVSCVFGVDRWPRGSSKPHDTLVSLSLLFPYPQCSLHLSLVFLSLVPQSLSRPR